jgi:hypothetical protein
MKIFKARRQMKKAVELADLFLKGLSCLAILCAGGWAVWTFWIGGSVDWQNNITLDTRILPYHDNLRLLVVHIKSKNPRMTEFVLDKKLGDSYQLRIRKVGGGIQENGVIDEDSGEMVATADLLSQTGDQYEFLPGAEMDDMRIIVLPLGETVALTAEIKLHTGSIGANGEPNTDFVSTSSIVRVEP